MTSSTCYSQINSRLSLATLSGTFLVDHWLQVYFLSSFIPMIQQAGSKPSLFPLQWLPNFISQGSPGHCCPIRTGNHDRMTHRSNTISLWTARFEFCLPASLFYPTDELNQWLRNLGPNLEFCLELLFTVTKPNLSNPTGWSMTSLTKLNLTMSKPKKKTQWLSP
jgi:hypothetical protein